jgi:hypothetical protein
MINFSKFWDMTKTNTSMEKELANKETLPQSFELILGSFSAEDAKEILMNLITGKIDFHKKRSFSNEIRFGEPDAYSENRINQLTLSKNRIYDLIELASAQNALLNIKSNIEIDLI